jgi:CDGSH-type Zn-finger protein
MARMVRHTATGPYKIDPSTFPPGKMISICACGLSKTMPICDGTHKTCMNEEPGKVYVYDAERKAVREVVDDHEPQSSS